MDPDGRWTSTRATLLAVAGQNCWPPAGSYMAADTVVGGWGGAKSVVFRAAKNFLGRAGCVRVPFPR